MKNRAYRYFAGEPLYGLSEHGLSYTTFEYSGMKLSRTSYAGRESAGC